MTLNKRLTLSLTLAICAVAAASCETPGGTFPSAEDLRVEAKPVPSDEVLTSREAGEKHDNAIEAWGERGWLQVGRLCRFFDAQGMPLPVGWCPAPPRRPDG